MSKCDLCVYLYINENVRKTNSKPQKYSRKKNIK